MLKVWSNYSDLTRPHPKWWFSKGNLPISGKPRLVKYYKLARKVDIWEMNKNMFFYLIPNISSEAKTDFKQKKTYFQTISIQRMNFNVSIPKLKIKQHLPTFESCFLWHFVTTFKKNISFDLLVDIPKFYCFFAKLWRLKPQWTLAIGAWRLIELDEGVRSSLEIPLLHSGKLT